MWQSTWSIRQSLLCTFFAALFVQLNYIAAVSVCGCLLLRIDQYVAKNMGLILHPFPFRPCEVVL